MLRLGNELLGGAALDDLAGVHDDDVVGELGDHAEVVCDEDDRWSSLRA